MTNTVEMPEKIWARYRLDFPYEPEWSLKKHADSDVSYIREDTIPSKAEVAREFFERVKCVESEYHRNRTGMIVSGGGRDAIESRIIRTMGQVLKEWEDAETK